MKRLLLVAMLALFCAQTRADVIYQQSPNLGGGLHRTSWLDPDGSNYDQYVWDAFTLVTGADIGSIEWRGAYDPTYGGAGGPVIDFTVGIYASIAAGTQPDVSQPPLVEYVVGDNAGEAYAGIFGGASMYDYSFTLPVVFHAQAGVKYWVQIEGWQRGTYPDWGIAAGLGGDGHYFLCDHSNLASLEGVPTGCYFTTRTGDGAFTLHTAAPTGIGAGSDRFELSLRGSSTSRGDLVSVWFSLPDAAPATLALFDVAGRRIASQEVGDLGAGTHAVEIDARMAQGVCFVRLSRAHDSRLVKVIVAR